MSTRIQATVEDLRNVPDNAKAEIVDAEIVIMSPTGFFPGRASGRIYASLLGHEMRTRAGYAIPDNVGFVVNLPGRGSFSPDAAWYTGAPAGMRFVEGAPAFAVEVRSAGDYDAQAERDIARKRLDYFAAGALVVWDVDLLAEDVVRVYRSGSPDVPTVYRRGELAEAEPAVPGWSMPVDELFA